MSLRDVVYSGIMGATFLVGCSEENDRQVASTQNYQQNTKENSRFDDLTAEVTIPRIDQIPMELMDSLGSIILISDKRVEEIPYKDHSVLAFQRSINSSDFVIAPGYIVENNKTNEYGSPTSLVRYIPEKDRSNIAQLLKREGFTGNINFWSESDFE